MLDCLLLILSILVLVPLRLFIVIYGLHPFRVLRATNIMFFFLITTLVFCALSYYFTNLKFIIYLRILMLLLIPNLNSKSTFQCDYGGEFDNKLFYQFCNNQGIHLRFSFPQTSSQNGKFGRKIHSINNIVRTILCHASLPPYFWPHALNTATYLLNVLLFKLLGNLTPTHLLYNKSPSYTRCRVFGLPIFVSGLQVL